MEINFLKIKNKLTLNSIQKVLNIWNIWTAN